MTSGITFRRPTDADYATIVRVVDDWWDERRQAEQLPRFWLQHFCGTSWLAEDATGRLAGFVVGFVSPAEPATAYCHLIGTAPNLRRSGIGRALYERFFDDARTAGARRVVAMAWPGSPTATRFHARLGFEPQIGPGSQNLYGLPAFADYEFGRADRAVFVREL